MKVSTVFFFACSFALISCETREVITEKDSNNLSDVNHDQMQIAHLSRGDDASFQRIKNVFAANNPGYNLFYDEHVKLVEARDQDCVVFIQAGGGTARIHEGPTSKISVGDIVLLKAGSSFQTDSLISALSFDVPEIPFNNLPQFIRPDWDPNITDTPGGCATETGAYRRILITWLKKVGPYQFKSLNAHRVRIMDSFTHYHPKNGGFDEFYLVQMAMPGAKIYTSEYVDRIEDFENLEKSELKGLIKETPLEVGDLVYLPRGVMHRGHGGVLAQVITVPGFKPKSEIGLDYQLRKINEKFSLAINEQLPFNVAASDSIVIK